MYRVIDICWWGLIVLGYHSRGSHRLLEARLHELLLLLRLVLLLILLGRDGLKLTVAVTFPATDIAAPNMTDGCKAQQGNISETILVQSGDCMMWDRNWKRMQKARSKWAQHSLCRVGNHRNAEQLEPFSALRGLH